VLVRWRNRFVESVTDLLSSNPYIIVLALDFSKGFDSVRQSILFYKNGHARHSRHSITGSSISFLAEGIALGVNFQHPRYLTSQRVLFKNQQSGQYLTSLMLLIWALSPVYIQVCWWHIHCHTSQQRSIKSCRTQSRRSVGTCELSTPQQR